MARVRTAEGYPVSNLTKITRAVTNTGGDVVYGAYQRIGRVIRVYIPKTDERFAAANMQAAYDEIVKRLVN